MLPGYFLAALRFVVIVLIMLAFFTGYGLIVLSGSHRPGRAFRMRRMFVRVCMWVFGVRLELDGRVVKMPSPTLYVSNHRSLIDPVVMSHFIDVVILSKAEVEAYPIIGRAAKWSGVIYVHRHDKGSRSAAREALEGAWQEGFDVLVYPEGTVSGFETTLPFRPGSFETALDKGVPVIPIAVAYRVPTLDYWQNGPLLVQYFRKFSKWKTECRVSFGPVLEGADGGTAMMEEARRWIDAEIVRMQEGWVRGGFPGALED